MNRLTSKTLLAAALVAAGMLTLGPARPIFCLEEARKLGLKVGMMANNGSRKPSVTMSFDQPFEAEAVYLYPGPLVRTKSPWNAVVEVQVSDDGEQLKTVDSFEYKLVLTTGLAGSRIAFDRPVKARFIRLQLQKMGWPFLAWLADVEFLQAGETPSMAARTPYLDGFYCRLLNDPRMSRYIGDTFERISIDSLPTIGFPGRRPIMAPISVVT